MAPCSGSCSRPHCILAFGCYGHDEQRCLALARLLRSRCMSPPLTVMRKSTTQASLADAALRPAVPRRRLVRLMHPTFALTDAAHLVHCDVLLPLIVCQPMSLPGPVGHGSTIVYYSASFRVADAAAADATRSAHHLTSNQTLPLLTSNQTGSCTRIALNRSSPTHFCHIREGQNEGRMRMPDRRVTLCKQALFLTTRIQFC